jgi:hypothetical protein
MELALPSARRVTIALLAGIAFTIRGHTDVRAALFALRRYSGMVNRS